MEGKRVIEINGVKLEVDLSTAKVIDEYKVGDAVKVLKKKYSDYKSFPGVIIGFEPFKKLPSIILAYLDVEYGGATVNFAAFNSATEDIEICPAMTPSEIGFEKGRVIELLDREIVKKDQELADAVAKKKFFLSQFGKVFGEIS